MTVRHLDALLNPGAIALVGASDAPGSIGAILAANLEGGGFQGPIMPVNPRHREVGGMPCFPDLDHLPARADLGVICTPPAAVPGIVSALGRQGARAAAVITAGFAEDREARGTALQRELKDAARPWGLRVLGPNCVGLLVPGIGLNASFAHRPARPGNLAFLTQSGAILTCILDWAEARGIGFSYMLSLGDMADLDFGDLLDYLAADPWTSAILLYVESVGDARKFISAARAAARVKPVVAVKAGRHAEGARAVASHTGALAGSDTVCQAAFDRAGILRVFSLAELFDAVETLALARPVRGDRLAILTNGGGVGVLATDALIEEGGRLATLSEATLAVLDRILPRTWSHGNPVDMIGDAGGRRYREAIAVLRQDPGLDAILALHCPTAVVSALEAAEAVACAAADGPLLLTSWVGEGAMTEARRLFAERGIPSYGTPEQAVRAFMHLVRHRHARGLLAEATPSVPDGFAPDRAAVAALISATLGEGRRTLTEPEAKRVLAAYGVPAVATRTATTPEEAAAIAAEMGGPLVLKILSPDISHKSDLGGVVLDLVGPGAVLEAARGMLGRIRAARPRARIQGFAVEPMIRRPGAQELIVGIAEDPQFGPIVLVGQGGTAVEAIADRAIGLPPLNRRLARELIAHTRIHRVLLGGRGQPPADLDALALTLVQVAQLAIDVPEIRELDINPLLIDPTGVIALDARIALAEVGGSGSRPGGQKGVVRLAIRPYPRELETEIQAGDGRRLLLRPIRPEDEPALRRTFALLGPRSSTHLFGTKGDLDQATAARLTQIDYEREMILVVTEPGSAAPGAIHGLVRLVADPDREQAEVDLATSEAIAGLGIEPLMLRHILDHAKHRGIREVYADVPVENDALLRLYEGLGFQQGPSPDAGNIRVSLHLKAGTATES